MTRYDIINKIISKYEFSRYLEIGVDQGKSFEHIKCAEKVGVDPDSPLDYVLKLTSDEFFETYQGEPFDLIFIDGLHHAKQVIRDIDNALQCLSTNGYIVVHDTMPSDEIRQRVPRESLFWNGDVWKAIHFYRTQRNDVELFTMNCDHGCTVIRRGTQLPLPYHGEGLTWEYFVQHKKELLNLKEPQSLDQYLRPSLSKKMFL